MTEKEFRIWLHTCPSEYFKVVKKDGDVRTVNFLVDEEEEWCIMDERILKKEVPKDTWDQEPRLKEITDELARIKGHKDET